MMNLKKIDKTMTRKVSIMETTEKSKDTRLRYKGRNGSGITMKWRKNPITKTNNSRTETKMFIGCSMTMKDKK